MENPAPEGPLERRGPKVPPGSTLDRGMHAEKRRNDCPEEDSALNSGGPERGPSEAIHLLKAPCDQQHEDVVAACRESDPPIVVGDGRTDHMAKGRAEGQSGQSALTRGKGLLPQKACHAPCPH